LIIVSPIIIPSPDAGIAATACTRPKLHQEKRWYQGPNLTGKRKCDNARKSHRALTGSHASHLT
jgi:hypothetical protein